MRLRVLPLSALAFALCAAPLSAQELIGHLVVNGDVTATFEAREGAQQFGGRMSGHLILNGETLEQGARVEGLNVVLFGVDQQLLTGRPARNKPTGVVGFSATADRDQRQRLRYDPRSRALVGEIKGRLDMPQFSEMTELRIDPSDDFVETPTVEAVLEVRIGLDELGDLSEARERPIEIRTEAEMTLSAGESTALGTPAFDLSVRSRWLEVQLVYWPWFEIGQRLCIQPVRILSFGGGFPFPFFFHLSGDGLPFGQPGAKTQWAKADVVFTYRDFITLLKPQFSTFSSDEAADLLAEVDVDDCIEVFFVDRFSPQTLFGGGATFGLGVASSKVISSDENADFGVDLTHLAHEFGHVLDLGHPDGSPGVSTGTLMCPSGFNNDNPKVNSQENKDNVSNPLLTFALKFVSPGPDCQNSADCGPCP